MALPAGDGTALVQLGLEISLVDLETGEQLWTREPDPADEEETLLSFVAADTGMFVTLQVIRDDTDWEGTYELSDLASGEIVTTIPDVINSAENMQSNADQSVRLEAIGEGLFLRDTDSVAETVGISRLDLETGEPLWSREFAHDRLPSNAGYEAVRILSSTSDPDVVRVLAGDGPGTFNLHDLDLETGEDVRSTTIEPPHASAEISPEDDLLISIHWGSEDDDGPRVLSAWSLADVEELWTAEADNVSDDQLPPVGPQWPHSHVANHRHLYRDLCRRRVSRTAQQPRSLHR